MDDLKIKIEDGLPLADKTSGDEPDDQEEEKEEDDENE